MARSPGRILFLASAIFAVTGSCSPKPAWSKAEWIQGAFNAIKSGDYPRIKALSYWNEKWENADGSYSDLRIDSSPETLTAYRSSAADPLFSVLPEFASGKLLAPSGDRIYLAAFPDFGGEEDIVTPQRIADYESLCGREIAWAYFSNNWLGGRIVFPAEDLAAIRQAGRVPFVRLMARSDFDPSKADSNFTLQKISNGVYDVELTQWFTQAKSLPYPLLAEFGTEMNGDWFPWSGYFNGGSASGPGNFISAYRHLVELYRAAPGADTITWFFHVNALSYPEESWNAAAEYYPGDGYVDWLAVSVYGPLMINEEYMSFAEIMNRIYPELAALSASKPIAVLEFGIMEPR